MIVDDDPAICALARATAEPLGFEVGTTLTGREFKRCYPDFVPDVVLVDLMLPDVDGTELLRFLAQAEATATIWIISAHYRNIRRLAIKLGVAYGLDMAGDLAKPVGMADLRAALTADTLDLDDIGAQAS